MTAREDAASSVKKSPYSRLIMSGALIGLVPLTGLIILRTAEDVLRLRWVLFPGDVVFSIIFASPYLLAVYAWTLRTNQARAPLLLSAAVLSFTASFSALSGVTLLLLPATIVLGIAAFQTIRASGLGLTRKGLLFLLAIASSLIIVVAFLSLYRSDDARCWRFLEYADGHTVWSNAPVPPGGAGGPHTLPPLPEGAVGSGFNCTSDIITPSEALAGLGLWCAGILVLAATARYSGGALREPYDRE